MVWTKHCAIRSNLQHSRIRGKRLKPVSGTRPWVSGHPSGPAASAGLAVVAG